MHLALVHDYLKEIGGAEKVLEVLSDIFPDADIFTSMYIPSFFGPHRSRLEKKWSSRIHTSFFQYLPFKEKLISPLRVLSPLAFKSFDFSKYDLIITSATGAYFPNSLNKKTARLVCYCHTPPRYLYGLPTARRVTNPILVFVVDITNHILRLLDFTYAQHVDTFIANSQTVSARIKKWYRKPSVVINPPISLPANAAKLRAGLPAQPQNLSAGLPAKTNTPRHPDLPQRGPFGVSGSQPFYLTGGRLARAKRFDLAILACQKLGRPLKIFGRDFAGYASELKSLVTSPNIEFLGEVTEEQKIQLYSTARAYLNPGADEDFGMTAPEAMAYGCPVIAHNSGGPAETVIDGKTGVLFNDQTVESILTAIQKFETLKLSSPTIKSHAATYSTQNFSKKIIDLLTSQKT